MEQRKKHQKKEKTQGWNKERKKETSSHVKLLQYEIHARPRIKYVVRAPKSVRSLLIHRQNFFTRPYELRDNRLFVLQCYSSLKMKDKEHILQT